MNRHGNTAACCCFVSVLGVFLSIAFASAPVMLLAFFAFLLAIWTTAPAPVPAPVEPEPEERKLYLEIRECGHVRMQRELARRGWQ